MTRILWLSEAPIMRIQEDALRKIFGEIEVIQVSRRFNHAQDLLDFFRRGDYDEMVYTGGFGLQKELTHCGLFPLWAKMRPARRKEETVSVKGRTLAFDRFIRIKGVEVVSEELEPGNVTTSKTTLTQHDEERRRTYAKPRKATAV